jgi:hypothetical protein
MMLVHQPFFVGGVEEVEKAKTSAFGAAWTFFLAFFLSIIYLISDAQSGYGGNSVIKPRSPSSRGEYDLVSLVQEYQPEDGEQTGEQGQFT